MCSNPATASRDPNARVGTSQFNFPSRFPSVDGWRALSILLVLGEHSLYTFDFPRKAGSFVETIFDGNLGVRFFFVISGFLITYLLLKEHAQTGAINIRKFYARRALRILPVYFTFLAVVLALQIFTPLRQPKITWIGNLTFTTNFLPMTWTTGHLWSLAVEEQFYLLWPIVLCLAGPQKLRRIFCLLGITIIVAPFCRMLSHTGVSWAWAKPFFQTYSSLNHFDSLAVGCGRALLLIQYPEKIIALLTRFSRAMIVMGIVLIIAPQMLIKSFVAESLTVPLANTSQAFGFALLLLQSIFFPQFFKPLNWSLVRQLGVLSYSIYIWQMLFCAEPSSYGLRQPWFLSFYGWVAVALLVAMCSYYCLEKPVMSLRARFRPGSDA
jgi:peptidoglycan/LPS O-acetylase OafA/YrhL